MREISDFPNFVESDLKTHLSSFRNRTNDIKTGMGFSETFSLRRYVDPWRVYIDKYIFINGPTKPFRLPTNFGFISNQFKTCQFKASKLNDSIWNSHTDEEIRGLHRTLIIIHWLQTRTFVRGNLLFLHRRLLCWLVVSSTVLDPEFPNSIQIPFWFLGL